MTFLLVKIKKLIMSNINKVVSVLKIGIDILEKEVKKIKNKTPEEWLRKNLNFLKGYKLSSVKAVIIHNTADTRRVEQFDFIDQQHKDKGWRGFGYNAIIEKNGRFRNGRLVGTETAGATGYNKNYIHIAIAGNLTKQKITPKQLVFLKKLLGNCLLLGLSIKEHKDLKGARTLCAGEAIKKILCQKN